MLLFVSCCNVCVAVLLVMPRCVSSLFVLCCAYLSVLVALIRSFVLFDIVYACCCYLLRVVMYAWRFSWSCLGVSDRGSFYHLLLRLCWLVC